MWKCVDDVWGKWRIRVVEEVTGSDVGEVSETAADWLNMKGMDLPLLGGEEVDEKKGG